MRDITNYENFLGMGLCDKCRFRLSLRHEIDLCERFYMVVDKWEGEK